MSLGGGRGLTIIDPEPALTAWNIPTGSVYSHRLGGQQWPENAKGSITGINSQGHKINDGGDLRVTSDSLVVASHDATIDAATDGTGTVTAMTLADIQATNTDLIGTTSPLPAGYWQEEPPASFDQILAEAAAAGAVICPEFKVVGAVAPAIAAIQAAGMTNKVICGSFRIAECTTAANAGIRAMLIQSLGNTTPATMLAAGVDMLAYDYTVTAEFTPTYLQSVYDAGIALVPFTLYRKSEIAAEVARIGRPVALVCGEQAQWMAADPAVRFATAPFANRRYPAGHLAQTGANAGLLPGTNRLQVVNTALINQGWAWRTTGEGKTLTVTIEWDTVGASANTGAIVQFGMSDDSAGAASTIAQGGYQLLLPRGGANDIVRQFPANTVVGQKAHTGGNRIAATSETFTIAMTATNVTVTNTTNGDVICNAANTTYRGGHVYFGSNVSDANISFTNAARPL